MAAAKRKPVTPKFPGANVSGKMLFRVNPRTEVYVDKNSTPEQLKAIKERYNPSNSEKIKLFE